MEEEEEKKKPNARPLDNLVQHATHLFNTPQEVKTKLPFTRRALQVFWPPRNETALRNGLRKVHYLSANVYP